MAKDSHIFSTKKITVFVILPYELLTSDVVNFEQLGTGFND